MYLVPPVAAQGRDVRGFDAELFQPNGTARTSVLALERPKVLGHLLYEGGVFLHLANDPVQA
ncbi:MAG: hypothetical protein ABEN55_14765, partial [Bradymonadaceae bacterium]